MNRALLVGVGTFLYPAFALAQGAAPSAADASLDADAPPANVHVVEEVRSDVPLVPRARDLLGSHVLVGGAVAPTWSLGKLGGDVPATRGLGLGLGFRADAGFGVSRAVSLGAFGSFASYSDGSGCDSCKGRSFAVGPFVRYHLVQGFRFDPWLMIGAAYRQISFDGVAGPRQKFSGVEWLHLELGADYYTFSGLGIGPYGALGLSSYTKRPDAAGDAAVNVDLSVGLRVLLDLPGR
jgi:hypothetical protein